MLAQVKNWDEDRLAPLDTVLIMMAIAEFLYCPHVPVKVTINEYIDISKITAVLRVRTLSMA